MEQFTFTAKDICMDFPGVRALEHVDFEIRSGEIRAVVGTNGAGKSTLMKIFSGVCPDYRGEIYCNQTRCFLNTPAEAGRLGIRTVHQEVDTALFPNFAVYENLMLDDIVSQSRINLRYNRKKMMQCAADILAQLDIRLDLRAPMRTLTLAQKQLLLIAKEIHRECRLLILDEPTAALSRAETEKLFQMVRQLAEKKATAAIFISHRIAEILDICDSCTVLCNGRVTDTFPLTKDTGTKTIVEKMLGGSASGNDRDGTRKQSRACACHPILLEVDGLSDREQKVKQVSFYIKRGEIVGLAGLVGAGKTEICKTVFGARRRGAGTIRVDGAEVNLKNPADAVRHNMALVPEERRREGIFAAENIAFHLSAASLGTFCRFSFVNRDKIAAYASGLIKKLGVVCRDGRQPVRLLSGGNQQKVVIGKWIAAESDIYLFDEPMQGVDVGAKQELFALIRELAEKGAAVLYASCDVSELLAVTDRIYTLYDGRVTAELDTHETNEKELTYYVINDHNGG